jgi:hypothetical protein
MNAADRRRFRRRRMAALRIAPPLGTAGSPTTALAVTKTVGALQAQDYLSGAWSLGLRSGLTYDEVDQAVRRKEVVRTWPMRGTIHWVPAEDARWMCRLLALRRTGALESRHRELGIGSNEIDRAATVFERHLGDPVSRPRVVELLAQAGIDPSGQRGIHLIGYHAQTGLICQGPLEGSQPTFVLVDAWVPRSLEPDREEAMATVVERYLRGHGPVTELDIARWMAQTAGFVRQALALLGDRVVREQVGGRTYLSHADAVDAPSPTGVHLLPQWDELLLGYQDRELSLLPAHTGVVVPGRNMVFKPTLVVDGEVSGIWGRRTSGRRTVLTVTPFTSLGTGRRRQVEQAAAGYARFLGTEVEVAFSA